MTVVWDSWDLRKRIWFWVTLTILTIVHAAMLWRIPWTDKSYPAPMLFPFAVLDYGIVYGCIKLAKKIVGKERIGPESPLRQ
jgi:hypothetical protein